MRVNHKIETKEDIIILLNGLKPYEQNYISRLNENSIDYELACEKVAEYLIQIEEALIGTELNNNENMVNADIRMFTYWDYLKGKITVGKLFKEIKKHTKKTLLINLD
jgi:hypothetical protein